MKYYKDNYYHIFNRGCNKQPIFFSDDNYIYLLKKIKESYQEFGINILAYCFMPNHYHFLIQQMTYKPVSDWLRNIFGGYTQAINKQQQRRGTLFEGRAKAILVDKEEYLIHLMRYIHNNPVKADLVNNSQDWKYSNYLECAGIRAGSLYNKKFIIQNFSSRIEYKKYFEDYQAESKILKALDKYLID